LLLDAARFDDCRPVLDLAFDKRLCRRGRPLLGWHHGGADLEKLILHSRAAQRFVCRFGELANDILGHALGQEQSAPEIGMEVLDALFVRAGKTGKQRRTITGEDRDRLGLLAFQRADRGSGERAVVIDPAGEQVLHGLRRAAISHVGNIDAERGIDPRACEVRGGADAARRKLHLGVVRPGVGGKLLHVTGRKITACDQHHGLVGDEPDR
jgi:hypothetical protein